MNKLIYTTNYFTTGFLLILFLLLLGALYAEPVEAEFDLKYNPPKGMVLAFEPDVQFKEDLFLFEDIAIFIMQFEPFHSKCYWDVRGYSQGHGQKCMGGKLKKEHAYINLLTGIKGINDKLPEDLTYEQRIGIVSFLYNHPYNQDRYVEMIWNNRKKFLKEVKNKSQNHTYIDGVRYGGLLARRQAELQLINNF